MKRIFICSLVVLIFSGCQALLLKMYGIRDPKVETETSIVNFAGKKELLTNNIVTIKPEEYLNSLKNGIPHAKFFDSDGSYIEYRTNDSSCNGDITPFIKGLSKSGKYSKTGATDLQTELNKLLDLHGNTLPARPEADFYILMYWTMWTGRINKEKVRAWEEEVLLNKKVKIHTLKVNLDLQERWGKAVNDSLLNIWANKKTKK